MKILILCTGNSCRSQMAHGFLQAIDKDLTVRSAGTEPALKVNAKAVKVMQEIKIDISSHTPHLVDEYLSETWDYVITVCDDAKETCPVFMGQVTYRLHIGFEDPSYVVGSEDFMMSEFRRVRDEIKAAFEMFYRQNIKKS
jgi:arsenate reductase (thioredoxin)